jgi:release factor glutamine methyltransferase
VTCSPTPDVASGRLVAFAGIDLLVGPGVFTPQPETEPVVRAALAALATTRFPVVVDLAAGAGTIGFAVAHAAPHAKVWAVEPDEAALAWARRNRERLRLDVTLVPGRAADALQELDGRVHVVVSNPPYVAEHELAAVDPEVRDRDPHTAMLAGADGLDVVREVERAAWRLLVPGGTVVVEHSDRQGRSAPEVFAARWQKVRDCRDQLGRDRYVVARRP